MITVGVMLAVMVEAIIEYVKEAIAGKFPVETIVALVISFVFAFGAGLDIFEITGIEFQFPYVGSAIMALFMSRGANWLHDIFDKLLQDKSE